MREMKDSGIEWIGQVPNNWKLKKGKYLFKQHNNRGNLKCLQLLSPSQKFGVIPQTLLEELTTQNVVKVSEKANLNDFKTVHAGDFCISLRSFQGGFEYSRYEGVVSPAYQIFSAIGDNLCDGYYRYLFKDKSFIDKMNSYTMTLRDGKNIAFDDFGNTYIPVPTKSEQEKIANFLDSKCSEIDAISADIQKEIETLEQYKRSVITEAVTKGLNPDVKMESVNIQYIVKKPSNWGILRLKYVLTEQKARTMTGAEDLLSVSQYKGVILATDNIMRTMQAASLKGYRIVHIGDLVFNKLNPGLARFGASDYNGITSPDYAVYKANPRIAYAKYLEYILKTERYVSEYKRQSTGVGDGFSRLYTYQLYEIKVALPPIDEQKEIIDYLQSICYKIETAIQEKKKQVDILNAYKKSLIYEYVTGKKEVPNEQ